MPEVTMKTKFYHFRQNNSGGRFDRDDNVDVHVIVEATSPDDANRRAEKVGLYFDGFGDCECCGNRWYTQWSDDTGTEAPCIYDTPVSEFKFCEHYGVCEHYGAYVYYVDGRKEHFGLPVEEN